MHDTDYCFNSNYIICDIAGWNLYCVDSKVEKNVENREDNIG